VRKALELPHGLAGPPHDRRRAFPAFLFPQALGGGGQLCDGVLQLGGVHHHAADGDVITRLIAAGHWKDGDPDTSRPGSPGC
jgi:hypothetical protein